jgi:hypothetical protein
MVRMRRTLSHGSLQGWSAVAVHLEPSEPQHGGFHLTLFPEERSPTTLFLRPEQLLGLCELSAREETTDRQLWEALGRIPLEPLLPSRSLAARLRALLVDRAVEIRQVIETRK